MSAQKRKGALQCAPSNSQYHPTTNTELPKQHCSTDKCETTRRESADHYNNIVHISANYRVIICRDAVQWIIQHRRGKSGAGARWRSVAYCQARKALIREWHAKTGDYHGAVALGRLPEKIGGRG